MPRPRKPVPPPTNTLVGSAANVNIPGATPRRRRTGQTQDWQATSWQFYDTVGEYRFAANWIGNALSRIELTVVQDTEHGRELLLEGPAVDALEALFDGDSGKS